MAGLYDEKIVGLKEQRDLARRLREQASAPAEMGQMVSGWYVPNYGNAITNALRNVVGGYQERQADEELKGIEQERGRAMIDALAQGGMKVPQSMLTQYGQKAQEPSFIDKSIAFLRGQEAPKATPAQAYQPNVNVNATPDDKEAAMYQALMINPEDSAPFINLYTASENRKATQAEKEYNRAWEQQKFAAEQAARKENAQENRDFRREMADIAAGNRQPSQPFGIETINGQPVRVNKITGEVQAVNIPGMAQLSPKLTEDQAKASNWLTQASNAFSNMQNAKVVKDEKGNPILDPITGQPKEHDIAPTFSEAMMPKGSEAENYMRSGPRQLYMQGADSLSEALLRAATGSGVNESEAKQKVNELTPRWSDDPQTRAQKERAIPIYIESLKARAGLGAKNAEEVLQSQGVPSRFSSVDLPVTNIPKDAIQAEFERRQKLKGGQ